MFTGSVEDWIRDEFEGLVERHCGAATESVSRNTDYLVFVEDPGETNREDADANDIPEIDPAEFFDMLADRSGDVER